MSLLAMTLVWLTGFTIHPGITHLQTMTVHTPQAQEAAVRAAVASLNGSGARWSVTTDPPTWRPGEVDISSGPVDCRNRADANWACTNTVTRDGAIIWAGITLGVVPPDHLRTVLLHELGHAAGLDHSPYPRDVMSPGSDIHNDYSPGDMAGLRRLL